MANTILGKSKKTDKKEKPVARDYVKLRQRFSSLMQKRQRYEKVWKDIKQYELPHIGIFDDEEDLAKNKTGKIYNSTTWEACQIFAAGVMSGLTPPSRQWFNLTMDNAQMAANSDVAKILDERQQILQAVLAKSNFYTTAFSCYTELPYGQAPMGIFTDPKYGVRYVPYTIGTYALEAGANGEISTFARRFRMTASQLVEQFGTDNCPLNVLNAFKSSSSYNQTFIVNWLVEPNSERTIGEIGRSNMPYRSVYWVEGQETDRALYDGGFEEFPVPVARYTVVGHEAYGKGAAWFALDDARMLQKLEYDHLMAIELGVKPPMQAPSGIMGQVNLFPGGITESDTGEMVKPLFDVRLDTASLMNKIRETEDRIKRFYSADLFMMIDQIEGGQMTAREVMERSQEKLQQLGPVVERLLSEWLNPIIERTYNILDRAGIFPELPDELAQELADADVKIEYISPLAQAQKMSSLTNIEQLLGFVANAAQFDQSILGKLDLVQAVNIYASSLGAPAPMLKSDEEFQQALQAQQQAQQQAQEQQQAMQMAQAAPQMAQAAKVATEAANDGNPALQEWLGM